MGCHIYLLISIFHYISWHYVLLYFKSYNVTGFGGAWGMVAVGLFAEKDLLVGFSSYAGLFHGGGFYLLGVQILACVCCMLWSSATTYILIKVMLV